MSSERRTKTGRRTRERDDPAADAPLERVLDRSEQVQGIVEEAATQLGGANNTLKAQLGTDAPIAAAQVVLDQSMEVEAKVQEAAEELVSVNDALAHEIDERMAIEHQLVEKESELSVSRIKEKRARHDSLHDSTTGLPNAGLFNDRLENAVAQARRVSERLGVMFIDLDDFKAVNDSHGHDVGDEVLCAVAERIRRLVRSGDTVSRRGGDEFLYLMRDARDAANAALLSQKIRDAISAPIEVDGRTLTVHASVGVAMFPEDGDTSAELQRRADAAMYEKKRGRGDDEPSRGSPTP